MGRSAVLSGRFDARDRAKVRHRRDPVVPPTRLGRDALWAFLVGSPYAVLEAGAVARIDTTEFLRGTPDFEMAPEERLRWLAILLERKVGGVHPRDLDRIYAAALELAPRAASVWHSRGIAACLAGDLEQDREAATRAAMPALRWLHAAQELDPLNADILCHIGQWHYDFGDAQDEAASWFERTIELEPRHHTALLYRAYCLQDAERWTEAIAAYQALPLDAFKGSAAWLVDEILEAQSFCQLRTGDPVAAVDGFRRLLDRLEKEPMRGLPMKLQCLREAAQGPLRLELGERYAAFIRLERGQAVGT